MDGGSESVAQGDTAPRAEATSVQFGLFDWIDRSGVDLADIYEQRLKMLEYADRAGYYCCHVAEHHGTPLGMAPSPSVFLAAAAQRTRRLRLGPLVYIVPLYNPMRLAEEICMLDHLSRGRLELGVGRGSTPYELAMLGVDVAETRERYREAMEIVMAALAAGEVSYEGRYYTFRNARLEMRPYQRPYPPLWYPTSNPETIPWVAQQGYHTLLSFNTPTPEETRRRLDVYKRFLPEARGNPSRVNPHVAEAKYGVARKVYVAETDAEALRVARAALAEFRYNFTYLWELHGVHRYTENLADLDSCLERGVLFAGSPATVRARIAAFMDATGGNYFAGCFAWGGLTTDQILRSLHLFTQEVLPTFRRGAAAGGAS
jgi:alkanesulfonate monooxygenase SsuD/methylene tetrahydromethanopterin reductase-like flavin-dependent oxidoreductase (luciferase family)